MGEDKFGCGFCGTYHYWNDCPAKLGNLIPSQGNPLEVPDGLRDQIAIAAMQGMIAGGWNIIALREREGISKLSYEMSDEMLKARNEGGK